VACALGWQMLQRVQGEGTTPRAGLQTPARLSGTRRALLRSALHSASRCSLRAASGCERLRRVPPPQSRKRRAHASAFRSPAASQRAHGALERASEPEAPSALRAAGARDRARSARGRGVQPLNADPELDARSRQRCRERARHYPSAQLHPRPVCFAVRGVCGAVSCLHPRSDQAGGLASDFCDL